MLSELWHRFGTLPQWQQAVGSAAVLVVLWLVVRGARSMLGGGDRETVIPVEPPEREPATVQPGSPDSSDADSGNDKAEVSDSDDSWARGRPLCACCGCPTDADEEALGCAVCDWFEQDDDEDDDVSPLDGYQYNLVPQPVQIDISSPRRDHLIEVARRNFATYGSAFSPEDRTEQLGGLTDRAIELRRELREQVDYLRHHDPADLSERWDKLDETMAQLRAELEPR